MGLIALIRKSSFISVNKKIDRSYNSTTKFVKTINSLKIHIVLH